MSSDITKKGSASLHIIGEPDTITGDVYVVSLSDPPEDLEDCQFLWGYVGLDRKGRWSFGDWFRTTCIVHREGNLFKTRRTLYRVDGKITEIMLDSNCLEYLNYGTSPVEYLIMIRNQADGERRD